MAPKMLSRDSSRSKAQLGVGALVLGFVFLSWCVLVAGVSAVQHRANNRNALEFEWWIISFEFFLVVLAALELAGFRRGHSGLVALKAVNTALIMFYCQRWNDNRRSSGFTNIKAVRTTFAGFILLAIANSLLILSMGTEPHHNRDAQYGAPVATGPAGLQGTRTTTNLEGGGGQTVV